MLLKGFIYNEEFNQNVRQNEEKCLIQSFVSDDD